MPPEVSRDSKEAETVSKVEFVGLVLKNSVKKSLKILQK
jgi:hypothetical protein